VPWGDGKRTLTNAYMLFLARWARRLSWKETAEAFHTSWEKVFDAVEHVVTFGLAHRTLGQIDAIGVDEIQYACNGPQKLDTKKAFLRWWAALKIEESQCPKRARVTRPA
jgi:hypothetical protein